MDAKCVKQISLEIIAQKTVHTLHDGWNRFGQSNNVGLQIGLVVRTILLVAGFKMLLGAVTVHLHCVESFVIIGSRSVKAAPSIVVFGEICDHTYHSAIVQRTLCTLQWRFCTHRWSTRQALCGGRPQRRSLQAHARW